MPEFLSLPNELILEITESLPLHDISALVKTNHQLSDLSTATLLTELFHSRSLTHGRRLLFQLASQQDLIRVKDLLARGILGFTEPENLLHEVVRSQSVQALQTLLDSSLIPDLGDSERRTVLGVTVKLGHLDPNEVGDFGQTALHIAANTGNYLAVECLLADERVNANIRDLNQHTAFHCAVIRKQVEIVKLLLSHPRVEVNLLDVHGLTPLHAAIANGSIEVVRLLLSSPRVDVNLPEASPAGNNALHHAIMCGRAEIVQLFAGHSRLDVNLPNRRGKSALELTEEVFCPVSVIESLLQRAL